MSDMTSKQALRSERAIRGWFCGCYVAAFQRSPEDGRGQGRRRITGRGYEQGGAEADFSSLQAALLESIPGDTLTVLGQLPADDVVLLNDPARHSNLTIDWKTDTTLAPSDPVVMVDGQEAHETSEKKTQMQKTIKALTDKAPKYDVVSGYMDDVTEYFQSEFHERCTDQWKLEQCEKHHTVPFGAWNAP